MNQSIYDDHFKQFLTQNNSSITSPTVDLHKHSQGLPIFNSNSRVSVFESYHLVGFIPRFNPIKSVALEGTPDA